MSLKADNGRGPSALDEIALGSLTLGNRVVVAPMTRVSAEPDGLPSEQMTSYYERFAIGGFGLVITEGTFTDFAFARGYRLQPGLVTDRHVGAWRLVTHAVHRHRTAIIAQLMHAGALSQALDRSAGPSAVLPKGEMLEAYGGSGPYRLPKAMTEADIEAAIASFASAAANARAAGFDGVEIHGANGYLLDQFLTTYTNVRTDRYGGTTTNRVRLFCDVAKAVRAAVGDDFIVGMRLSQTKVNDPDYRWSGVDEAEAVFTAVGGSGVDYLHIVDDLRGWREAEQVAPGVTLTKVARQATGLPVIANGGVDDVALLREILAEGHADLVALARGALANPDCVDKLRKGIAPEPFDRAMLHPRATLSNADQWRASRARPEQR
jgi:2,4-dienoyl-CoA reductase-like NADH-dependent reductase (Old Yellow Enzyme family)